MVKKQTFFLVEAAIGGVLLKKCSQKFCKIRKKNLCQSLNPQAWKCIKKRLRYMCFFVNFAKFLGAPFLQNTFGRLLSLVLRNDGLLKTLKKIIKKSR